MACFTVPLATAAVASAVKTTLPKSAEGNPFVRRLGRFGKMMFGNLDDLLHSFSPQNVALMQQEGALKEL